MVLPRDSSCNNAMDSQEEIRLLIKVFVKASINCTFVVSALCQLYVLCLMKGFFARFFSLLLA